VVITHDDERDSSDVWLMVTMIAERMFEITEITEFDFCQPLNREFGGSFVYLVFVCSHLDHMPWD
jgi:hypothetical protein